MQEIAEIEVGRLDELADPGCREFQIGDGDWPFRGFIVRRGDSKSFRGTCASDCSKCDRHCDRFHTVVFRAARALHHGGRIYGRHYGAVRCYHVDIAAGIDVVGRSVAVP